MSALEELIEKLPEKLRPIARRYLPAFVEASLEQLEEWVKLIARGQWQEAYRFAIARMTTAELVQEQQRLNEVLIQLNLANAAKIQAEQLFVQEILLLLVFLARAEIQD